MNDTNIPTVESLTEDIKRLNKMYDISFRVVSKLQEENKKLKEENDLIRKLNKNLGDKYIKATSVKVSVKCPQCGGMSGTYSASGKCVFCH